MDLHDSDDSELSREDRLTQRLKKHGGVVQRWLAIPDGLAALLAPEDIMQEAYLEAFLSIGSMPPQESEFRAWFGALADKCLREGTRVSRAMQRGGNNPLAGASGVLNSFSSGRAGGVSVRRNRRFQEMARIAGVLPDPYRTAAQAMLEELPPDRIAGRLGKSIGATYVVMGRTRQLLGQGLRRWRSRSGM